MGDVNCRYNINELAEELEVELCDIVKLYSSYFGEMREEIADMKKFSSEGNWSMLERVAHNVKGVSANLSILDVYNETAAFDALLKINVTESADSFINRIEQLLQAAENEIRTYFKSYGLEI